MKRESSNNEAIEQPLLEGQPVESFSKYFKATIPAVCSGGNANRRASPIHYRPLIGEPENAFEPSNTLASPQQTQKFPLIEHIIWCEQPPAARGMNAGRRWVTNGVTWF
jgi:hypothetical protein